MQGIYNWAVNIVCYMIFVTMIVHLLPTDKYEKYLRLFAGCILILLVLQPVTGGLRLDDKITGLFKAFSYESDMKELGAELDEIESRRLDAIAGEYEAAAAGDIERLMDMEGYEHASASVQIERQPDAPDFGKIRRVTLTLGGEDPAEAGEISRIEKIEPVRIRVEQPEESKGASAVSAPGKAESEELRRLREKIADYYQVEEAYVEIKLENE